MVEMIVCSICNHETENSLQAHLNRAHAIKNKEYLEKYPGSQIYSQAYGDRLRQTNADRDPSYKKKLAESTRKLYQDSDWVEKHNKALKKAQGSPEAVFNHRKGAQKYFENRTFEDISAQKERACQTWKDVSIRSKREKALKLAHNTPEAIRRHSDATRRTMADPIKLEKRKVALKKAWAEPEKRAKLEKIIKMGLDAAMSPEGRKNFKEAQKNPELRKKRSEIALKNIRKRLINRVKFSRLNIFLGEQMKSVGLHPEQEYIIGPYSVDFCFTEKRLIVEADGDFWHANPEFMKDRNITELLPLQRKTVGRDKARNTYFSNRGWKTLRFWERDIYSDPDKCISIIKEVLNG